MGQKLSAPDSELYRRVDEVLAYLWDPCCVAGTPEARGEYYAYLPKVFALLKRTADGNDIVEYLCSIESGQMGLKVSKERKVSLKRIGNVLVRYRNIVQEK